MKVLGVRAELLEQLGFGQDIALLQKKVEAVLRPRDSETHELGEKILLDSGGWFSNEENSDLEELLMAVRKDSRIEALYRSSGEKKSRWFVADPYGLVHKGRSWYLVADIDGAPRMLVASRLESFRVLSQPAQLRAGQTLASVWAELVDLLESDTSVYVTAILRASRLDMAQWILGSRLVQHDPVGRERVRIVVGHADIQGARQLLQLGDHIRVMDPPEAVDLIGMLASCLAERHGKGKR